MSVSISTLLNAVKPKDLTDQYVVLSGLYSIGGEHHAQTAAQIKEAIKLHLGSKTPANIPGRLRKYKAYVEPADPGPPLRWRLTADGMDRLRTLSELPLSAASVAVEFDYDIGIVCALEQPEFDAVRKAFGGASNWKEVGDGRIRTSIEKRHSKRQLEKNCV